MRTYWVGVTVAVVAMGVISALGDLRAVVAVGAVFALAIWFITPRAADKTPRWLILFVWLTAFAELLPMSLALVVEGLALAGSLLLWLRNQEDRRGRAVVGWSVAVLAYWGVLLLVHPNVPTLVVGLEGYRQAVFAVGGLILGCAIQRRHLASSEVSIIKALMVALFVSIVAHLWIPAIEEMVQRDAGEYTALFGGESRLQGVFAGPFHAALASVVVLGWGLLRLGERRTLALCALAIGGAAMSLALVRTAYIAAALAVVAVLLVSRSGKSFAIRLLGIATIAGLGYYLFMTGDDQSVNSTIESIAGYSSDNRFLNRLPGYREGLAMVDSSLFIGWGPGSAGDTLGSAFIGHQHVTPHNLLLKLAVEGGIVGLLLWGGLATVWWRAVEPRSRQGQLAVTTVVVFLGFGTTGSALDALPVSYFVLLFAGLAVRASDRRPDISIGTDEDPSGAEPVDDSARVDRQVCI